jgi:hypothetical protein
MRATNLRGLFGSLFIVAVAGSILNSTLPDITAQPTYKLDVKPHLNPLSTLKLDANRVSRTDLADDPGFRLQWHIKQADGKSASVVDARAVAVLELPAQMPGTFSVVLELFYPAYKGGPAQKGEFKPVSNVLTYKIEAGKVILLATPAAKTPAPKDKK